MAITVKGFSFIEFTAPNINIYHDLFQNLGFVMTEETITNIGKRRTYQQDGITFIANCDSEFETKFAFDHGASVCGVGFEVWSPKKAYEILINNGVRGLPVLKDCFGVSGVGESHLYLSKKSKKSKNKGVGLTNIDHITHNVYKGNMDNWADFYEKHFGFKELQMFDIKGQKTGLVSKAMGNGVISIPINEDHGDNGQIAEYLDAYNGEGVQHIALSTDDIYSTVEQLRENGIEFLDVPDTYYDMIKERIPNHYEEIDRMRENKILIDGIGSEGYVGPKILLQLFTKPYVGPVFFEIIQRKGNKGFGEGNFQALFEAMELDQENRGVL